LANQIKIVYLPQQITIKLKTKNNSMTKVSTATAKPVAKTAAASTTATKTATVKPVAKTSTAKATVKPVAKAKATATAKPAAKAKVTVAKKERKSRKGITRSFAADVTASVSPVMATVNAFIANPETSEDALKMIRLELRKAVRATRGTIRTRKASTK